MLPSIVQKLSEVFEKFPGVGPKTAERFSFYILKQPPEDIQNIINGLEEIKGHVKRCSECFNISFNDPCEICSDSRRQHNLICVVASSQDILPLEKTNEYRGVYHVLQGTINAPEGFTPDKLNIRPLIERIKQYLTKEKNLEVILALNPTIEGETTSLFLIKLLKQFPIKVSRLARGLPQGSDLQYADEVTLSNALKERKEI